MDIIEKEIKEMIDKRISTLSNKLKLNIPVKVVSSDETLKYIKKINNKETEINLKLLNKGIKPISLELWKGFENLPIADIFLPDIFKKPKVVIYLDIFMDNFLYTPIYNQKEKESAIIYTLINFNLEKILRSVRIIEIAVNRYDISIIDDIIMKGKWERFVASINNIALISSFKTSGELDFSLEDLFKYYEFKGEIRDV